MENAVPQNQKPPGDIQPKDNHTALEKTKQAVKGLCEQAPDLIAQLGGTAKEHLNAKGYENQNTNADTLTKLSWLQIDQAECERILAETQRVNAEIESIKLDNKRKHLENESLEEARAYLKSQNIPHYVRQGEVIIMK